MKKESRKKTPQTNLSEPISSYEQGSLNFDKVWLLFQETDRKFQETDRKFLETDRKFQETDRKFLETDRKFQETERLIKEESRKTEREIRKLANLFSSQWGRLIEAVIVPSCLKLFKDRGIDVRKTYTNVIIEGIEREAEFDVVLANGEEVVIVEVKTTFSPEDVDKFIEKMQKIRKYFPEYHDKEIYGAVAAIKYDKSSDRYAYKNGFFVLVNSGENFIKIANQKKFTPKKF